MFEVEKLLPLENIFLYIRPWLIIVKWKKVKNQTQHLG